MTHSEKVCLIICIVFILGYVIWIYNAFKNAGECPEDDEDF